MARRAEWLVVGQMVGNLGAPPWKFTDDDLIGSKLLGDVAKFMVQESGLKQSFLESYLNLLKDWEIEQDNAGAQDEDLYSSLDNQIHQEETNFSNIDIEQISSPELLNNNTIDGHL